MVAAAVVLLVGCHTITEEAPTEPSAVPEEQPKVGAITIPIILPASNPTPAPTTPPLPGAPAPGPAPTPAPPPSSPPPSGDLPRTVYGCGASDNNPPESSLRCTDEGSAFHLEVETALTAVTDAYPELFDFDSRKCINCYFVKDVDRYVGLVLQELSAVGLCAHWDGEEIAVKRTNAFSEQYDPILSNNHMRRGPGSYRGVCSPSWF
jgi:hypothetical protein